MLGSRVKYCGLYTLLNYGMIHYESYFRVSQDSRLHFWSSFFTSSCRLLSSFLFHVISRMHDNIIGLIIEGEHNI